MQSNMGEILIHVMQVFNNALTLFLCGLMGGWVVYDYLHKTPENRNCVNILKHFGRFS